MSGSKTKSARVSTLKQQKTLKNTFCGFFAKWYLLTTNRVTITATEALMYIPQLCQLLNWLLRQNVHWLMVVKV